MNDLTIIEIDTALTPTPEMGIWLANFVSKQTQQTYAKGIVQFVQHFELKSPDDFNDITRGDIITWRNHLVNSGASPRTIHNRLSGLSSLFKHLCETQNISRNPVDGVKRPRVKQDEVVSIVLTPEQVRGLLDAPNRKTLRGLRDRAVLHLLAYTGCRISEPGSLRIRHFFEDQGYPVLEFRIKGGESHRIAIDLELQLSLKEYLAEAPHAKERDAPLICGVNKGHQFKGIRRLQFYSIFKKYAQKVGLPPGVTPHSTRATFITEALENNCPIEAVQRSVGHKKISTTQMYDKRHRKHRDSASFFVKY